MILIVGLVNAKGQGGAYVHAIQFELPQLELKYSIPLKEKGIGNLPYGMNDYLQSPKSGISPVGVNYTFRPLSLFYKDKIGVAFYLNGFGAYLDQKSFIRYMVNRYSSNYLFQSYDLLTPLQFYGPAIGIAYRWHYRSYIIEPNFLFGFEHLDVGELQFEQVMKQYGTNQFLDYALTATYGSSSQHSYRLRMLMGRRYSFKKISTVFEFGIVADYIYSPYAYHLTISQASYGSAPAIQQLAVSTVYRQFNFGLYLKANLHKPLK